MAEEAKKRSITIIIDSNFLFVPLQFGVDIFEELRRLLGGSIRCVVPSTVLEELQLLRRDSKPSVKKQIDFAEGQMGIRVPVSYSVLNEMKVSPEDWDHFWGRAE